MLVRVWLLGCYLPPTPDNVSPSFSIWSLPPRSPILTAVMISPFRSLLHPHTDTTFPVTLSFTSPPPLTTTIPPFPSPLLLLTNTPVLSLLPFLLSLPPHRIEGKKKNTKHSNRGKLTFTLLEFNISCHSPLLFTPPGGGGGGGGGVIDTSEVGCVQTE